MSDVVQARPAKRARSVNEATPPTPFSQSIGRTRYVVLLAVMAVMLVALSLFVLGTIQAVLGVWNTWIEAISTGFRSISEETATSSGSGTAALTVRFLEIVSTMLKAVVFYIIGIGLYSLFIAPLNVTVALGVETLNDLETKVISVVIVIMGVTFLEHFIRWEDPIETLQFGAALAVVVFALVVFQLYSHRAKEDQKSNDPDVQKRAQRDLFQSDDEEYLVTSEEVRGTKQDEG
jgi:uncharacterized membrane protein YqhA